MRYITIPALMPIISIQFISSMSGLLAGNFDQVFNLYNGITMETGDNIATYFNAKIYINDANLKILGQIVREMTIDETQAKGLQTAYGAMGLAAENVQAAVIMISIIPILCFYPYIQKYFTQGLMVGSLKG